MCRLRESKHFENDSDRLEQLGEQVDPTILRLLIGLAGGADGQTFARRSTRAPEFGIDLNQTEPFPLNALDKNHCSQWMDLNPGRIGNSPWWIPARPTQVLGLIRHRTQLPPTHDLIHVSFPDLMDGHAPDLMKT